MLQELYNDSDILIINKPSGLPSNALVSYPEKLSAEQLLKSKYPELIELALAHRLDSDTSGVLVFTKKTSLFRVARDCWSEFAKVKIYSALCEPAAFFRGETPHSIDFPLGHYKKSSKKMFAIRHAGQQGQIRGKVLECQTEIISTKWLTPKICFLQVSLHGGVMHQIRCHLAEIGLPIIGDPIYGLKSRSQANLSSPASQISSNPLPNFTRMMLHHQRVELQIADQEICIEAKIPKEFMTG